MRYQTAPRPDDEMPRSGPGRRAERRSLTQAGWVANRDTAAPPHRRQPASLAGAGSHCTNRPNPADVNTESSATGSPVRASRPSSASACTW